MCPRQQNESKSKKSFEKVDVAASNRKLKIFVTTAVSNLIQFDTIYHVAFLKAQSSRSLFENIKLYASYLSTFAPSNDFSLSPAKIFHFERAVMSLTHHI